ncbi:hypothetical protein [Burkholderia sp. LMG 21824]
MTLFAKIAIAIVLAGGIGYGAHAVFVPLVAALQTVVHTLPTGDDRGVHE